MIVPLPLRKTDDSSMLVHTSFNCESRRTATFVVRYQRMQKLINVLVTYPESYPHVVEKCFFPEMHSRNILLSTKSRNHSLRFFPPSVLYSSASEVDRRQEESVVIGRQSNVVETSASESKRLWREKNVASDSQDIKICKVQHTNMRKFYIC